jgi:hypothetical protein
MPRSTAALFACLACLFAAGCSQNLPPIPPEPPDPQGPIVVVEEPALPPAERPETDANLATRQQGLRVMAAEQRALLQALEGETRFERTSGGGHQRVRSALHETHRELQNIERSIAILGDEDGISEQDRLARQDELKARLRRLATRLSLVENSVRER